MKKVFLVCIMAVMALAANAQVTVTPHVGLGYTNMSNLGDYKNGNGFLAGAEFECRLQEQFGISAGLDYLLSVSDKTRITDTLGNDTGNMYYTFSFINIPLLAQYHAGGFALKAGLQPSLCVGASYHEKNSSTSVKKGVETFGLSVPLGISYKFNSPIVLDLRCALPVTKQIKAEKGSKFTSVVLAIGYQF